MPIPERVKIGYRDYRIEDWSSREAYSAGRYGEIAHTPRVIRVDTSHGPRQSAETLLHEIIHGIFAVFPVYAKDEEERLTSGLSGCLATVWRDNPDVMAWIAAGITGGDG